MDAIPYLLLLPLPFILLALWKKFGPERGIVRLDGDAQSAVWLVDGGGNLPTKFGRINLSWPFVTLSISPSELAMVARPESTKVRPLSLDQGSLAIAQPAILFFGRAGLLLRAQDKTEWYFWANRKTCDALLARLEDFGYQTSHESQRARGILF